MGNNILIRNATLDDLDSIVELEGKIWPEGTRATMDKFKSRLRIFREGFFLAIKNNELVGASTSEIIYYDGQNPPLSWEKITDNGFIKRTHNPIGNTLCVVSIGAISRSGGGSALVESQKDLTRKFNLTYLILGARILGYDGYCRENGDTRIEEYVKLKREDGEFLDPELRFYLRNGLKMLKIVPNYMEDDKESRNYGAIMFFENSLRELT